MSNTISSWVDSRRILVVDDNADALLVMRLFLQLSPYEVQTSLSGQEALQLAEANAFDAVLLDISMPGMDGYEVCRRLRQQPGGAGLVVVALTGYGQADDVSRAYSEGFDGHFVKPVDMEALASFLEKRFRQLRPNDNA